MTYTESFNEIAESKKFNYLGHGNPNAKILIIGKEPRIDRNDESQKEQIKRDIDDNCEQWRNNIKDKVSYDILKNSNTNVENYNPLYPYKGQKCQVRIEKLNRGMDGTARTWVVYQKLFDFITEGEEYTRGKAEDIDFHKYVFSSDFSSEPAVNSQDTDKASTGKSIKTRNEMFSHKFFQDFPIVIVAAGHYPRDYKLSLEETFNVKWTGKDICSEDKEAQYGEGKFINVHYNKDRTKILIHTVQLSSFSYALLKKIAEVVRYFIKNDLKKEVKDFLL